MQLVGAEPCHGMHSLKAMACHGKVGTSPRRMIEDGSGSPVVNDTHDGRGLMSIPSIRDRIEDAQS